MTSIGNTLLEDVIAPLPSHDIVLPILTCHGDTAPRWKPGERLHHLFESVADRWPEATAVETTEGSLSFATLEGEANRLARLLADQGIGAGDVVALLFDRNVDAYIALLAVLKLHAAYVPLDPKFPADRVRYIATDAGVSAVLTVSEHVSLAAASTRMVLSLDQLADKRRCYSSDRVTVLEGKDDLAYVIYTSGSTGRPKGVRILHSAIVNFVRVAAATYGYQPGDRVYQGLTLAFDFSVEEIWVPLLAGATLVPSQSKGSLIGAELYTFLKESRISALCCVPTLLASLEEDLSDLPELRLLIVSGEACPEDIVRRWHRPGRMILNAYGPTEATVTATISVLSPDRPVTIGTPLPSYTIVILDREEPRALMHGEIGEIGIAGIGLSPGYLGRDDLTQKAFIPDFLGLPNNPSRRIYRTGDLGRVDETGCLEYLGRVDTQVKIRGYRIEVTEIESTIMEQPGIQQAVVDTFEASPGHVELVAYYTVVQTMTVDPQALAESLRERLPSYMVPAYYEPLEKIAMLPSDKADRSSLPPPSGQRLVRRCSDFVAPEGEIETQLATMLAELLGLDHVSVTHHFFDDLGANSLLMARFSTRIRRQFETNDIAMREIYLAPTIRQLAKQLGTQTDASTSPPPPRHEPAHIASNLAYWCTGAYQVLAMLLVTWGVFVFWKEGLVWCLEAQGEALAMRAVALASLTLSLSIILPVAAKWLLIGRWRPATFPIWGMTYSRFWTVKTLMRLSPLALVPGTPLYTAYLKMLGARVDWSALVQCPLPICTDLIDIGPQAVIGRGVTLQGYKAIGGRIVTGPIQVAARAHVGDGAVLDIDTRLDVGAELGHASALHQGQVTKAGLSYHGSPAEATAARFRSLSPSESSRFRQLVFSLAQVGSWMIGLALSMVVLVTLIDLTTLHDGSGPSEGIHLPTDTLTALPYLLAYCAAVFVSSLLLGLATVLVVPRLAWLFLREGQTYPLYGVRHWLLQTIIRTSNSAFFNLLFGDSSYIVHYLRAIGYRFHGIQQSGSNFGVQQRHDVPFLCEFGAGTMVSDGLVMANAEFSNATFRLGKVSFGRDCFLGNEIFYPINSKTGNNVLIGTKTMVPTEGARLENTGLLGSPAFEIPRSVARDRRFDHYKNPDILRERLRLKNRINIVSMALFLTSRFGLLVLTTVLFHVLAFEAQFDTALELAIASLLLTLVSTLYVVAIERATWGFGRLKPQYCSIYDRYFWSHERYWKLLVSAHLTMLNGTPFKGLLWRLLAMRVGRKLYDEGCGIPERSLVTIGDHCTLNATTSIQAHSLEDGTFKSDHIVLGDGVTLEPRAFVHYGTVLSDETLVETDAFLMKGERTALHSHWRGNPARPVTEAQTFTIDLSAQPSGGPSACARA